MHADEGGDDGDVFAAPCNTRMSGALARSLSAAAGTAQTLKPAETCGEGAGTEGSRGAEGADVAADGGAEEMANLCGEGIVTARSPTTVQLQRSRSSRLPTFWASLNQRCPPLSGSRLVDVCSSLSSNSRDYLGLPVSAWPPLQEWRACLPRIDL